jgi:hypothetical protein
MSEGCVLFKQKVFNILPASFSELINDKKHFILALKRVLIVEFFHSVNEYLNYQHD